MSIKEDLKALVQLQGRELEMVRIDAELAEVTTERDAALSQIATAEAVVTKAEKDAADARAEAKRLDLDLKAAEEKVSKYKDQMHNVKTNEQLWALQEEIGHAEQGVGDVETKILEQLEIADSLEELIGKRKVELVEENKRIDALVAEADGRAAELTKERQVVEAAVAEFSALVPDDLMHKYQGIKGLRDGVGVAEVLDEYCLVCHTKVRLQLYVETFNFTGVMRCENCKRIIFVAEPLGLAPASTNVVEGEDETPTSGPAPTNGGSPSVDAAPIDIIS